MIEGWLLTWPGRLLANYLAKQTMPIFLKFVQKVFMTNCFSRLKNVKLMLFQHHTINQSIHLENIHNEACSWEEPATMIIHNAAPPPLKGCVQLRSVRVSRVSRTASRGECSVPKWGSSSALSAFSSKVIKERNKLPVNLKTCTDFHIISREVQKWILSHQSCQC